MGKRTAVQSRDTRPDLATGYDEKISEARGLLKDLNGEVREARATLRKIKAEVNALQNKFLVELNEALSRIMENTSRNYQEAAQKAVAHNVHELSIEFRDLGEEAHRQTIIRMENWFDRMIRAIAYGVEIAQDPENGTTPGKMGWDEAQAFAIMASGLASNQTMGVPKDEKEAARNWAKDMVTETIPLMRATMNGEDLDLGERSFIAIPPDAYPVIFTVTDRISGKIIQRDAIESVEASPYVKFVKPKHGMVKRTITFRDGSVREF
jgi:hypothetical protein